MLYVMMTLDDESWHAAHRGRYDPGNAASHGYSIPSPRHPTDVPRYAPDHCENHRLQQKCLDACNCSPHTGCVRVPATWAAHGNYSPAPSRTLQGTSPVVLPSSVAQPSLPHPESSDWYRGGTTAATNRVPQSHHRRERR